MREVLQRSMSTNMHGSPVLLKASLTNVAFRRQRREGRKKRHSDGGLGEGHSKVVVLPKVMVVEFDEAVDGLLH